MLTGFTIEISNHYLMYTNSKILLLLLFHLQCNTCENYYHIMVLKCQNFVCVCVGTICIRYAKFFIWDMF